MNNKLKRDVLFVAVIVSLSPVFNTFASEDEGNLEETVVVGSKKGDFTIITEDTQKLVDTAGSLGDPLAAVFSLPGVVASDGDGGEPAVRGSGPDDNIYIVDFMPTSYIFHEFGVSVFSEFILQDFQMHSAGYGPEYSSVTGAVFDVTLRQPKQEPISAVVDFSVLRSGFLVEGEVTDTSAFYLSSRVSLIDLLVNEEDASDEDEGVVLEQLPRDYDYQFKYSWNPNDQHRVNLSLNGAGDEVAAELTDDASFVQTNPDFVGGAGLKNRYDGQNLVWEYFPENNQKITLGVGRLNDQSDIFWGDDYRQEISFVQDTLKGEYLLPLNSKHLLTFGFQHSDFNFDYLIDQILFVCTEFDPDCDLGRRERIFLEDEFNFVEQSVYVNETWMPTQYLTFDFGLQGQRNDHNDETYVHPRIAAKLDVTPSVSLKTKAGTYNQFPELGTVIPGFGNPEIRSPSAEHYTLGIAQDLSDGWSWSIEGYYKNLEDLPLALDEEEPDSDLLYSSETEGRAYGVDILVNKAKTGKWYSWAALSLGKSERTNLRTDETKDYRLDTPVIFNWVLNYQFTSTFDFGLRWTARSGAAYTPIVGVIENPFFEDGILPEYGDPYSANLPHYNRLDLRFKWDLVTLGKDSALIINILNALNHKNVLERNLDFDKVEAPGDEVAIEEEVGLGIVPALTYRVWF